MLKHVKVFFALAGLAGVSPVMGQCGDWVDVSGTVRPSGRLGMDLVYDGTNIVMFSGYRGGVGRNDETWVFDGEAWTQTFPNLTPIFRTVYGMAYHETMGKVIMFGGSPQGGVSGINDTWAWDGSTQEWEELFPATSPAARSGIRLVYDSNRDEIVMFGGYVVGWVNDTWTFDGTTWTQKFPATSPSNRNSYGMAYDVARDRTVLFGGYPGPLNDTWEWDGSNWSLKQANGPASSTQPRARLNQAVEYNPDREVVVLSGGSYGGGSFERLDDTWEWDGTAWTQLDVEGTEIRDQHGMEYHPETDTMYIFGGYAGGGLWLDTTDALTCESGGCYADCEANESLDLFDVLCFLNQLSAGSMEADCDGSSSLDFFDVLCFLNAFNAGC